MEGKWSKFIIWRRNALKNNGMMSFITIYRYNIMPTCTYNTWWDHHGRDSMVVGFTIACAISAYHH
jgi:hypothetical protein